MQFEQPCFVEFTKCLDGKMKTLKASGEITEKEEERLWEMKLLGVHSP